jgi:hypothetical protein
MSILGIPNMLWLGNKMDFADISWQKPNIAKVAIH